MVVVTPRNMSTILLLTIVAVGLFIAVTLRRIERQLAAWRAQHPADPVAFTPNQLATQREKRDRARSTLEALGDAFTEAEKTARTNEAVLVGGAWMTPGQFRRRMDDL